MFKPHGKHQKRNMQILRFYRSFVEDCKKRSVLKYCIFCVETISQAFARRCSQKPRTFQAEIYNTSIRLFMTSIKTEDVSKKYIYTLFLQNSLLNCLNNSFKSLWLINCKLCKHFSVYCDSFVI